MIVFRHCVSNFGNLKIEFTGYVPEKYSDRVICAVASTLMVSLVAALRKIDKPTLRLTVEDRLDSEHPNGCIFVRCQYTPETASMAQVTLAGFEWLENQAPQSVRIERVTGKTFSEQGKQPKTQ